MSIVWTVVIMLWVLVTTIVWSIYVVTWWRLRPNALRESIEQIAMWPVVAVAVPFLVVAILVASMIEILDNVERTWKKT